MILYSKIVISEYLVAFTRKRCMCVYLWCLYNIWDANC